MSNDDIKPQVDEYWTVKAGGGSFVYAKIIIEFPLSVRYFSLSVKEKCHKLKDEVLLRIYFWSCTSLQVINLSSLNRFFK